MRLRRKITGTFKHLFLLILLAIVMYPIYMVVVNAFKPERELYANILGLPEVYNVENFKIAIEDGNLIQAFFVSVILSAASVGLMTVLGSFAAFAITRRRSKGSTFLRFLFMAGITIPAQVGLMQLYQLLDKLDLVDSIGGLVLVYTAWGLPFTVYVMYGFFSTIPGEIQEAAIIDGVSMWGQYTKIIIPLSTNVISATIIYNLVWVWNDMLYPMIFVDSNELRPLANALLAFKGQFVSRYTVMFAGVVLASLPLIIVYLLMQKRFVAGMTAGSVKG